MTPKEYLSQYGQLNREIDRLLEEKARWMALALRATPSLSEEPKGGGRPGGRIPAAVEKIAEWEEKINEKIDRLVKLRQEIEERVRCIPDPKQREVLLRRYVQGQKWEQIAVQMNLDYRWVLRLHGRALLTIESHP